MNQLVVLISQIYFGMKLGQFLCPSSGVFHCTHSNGICHTGLLTACEQDQDGTAVPTSQIYFGRKYYMFRTVPLSIIRSLSLYTQQWYMSYRSADSLRAGSGWNCSKFEKLVHLVGFIIRKDVECLSFLPTCYIMHVFYCVSGQSRCMTFRAPMHEWIWRPYLRIVPKGHCRSSVHPKYVVTQNFEYNLPYIRHNTASSVPRFRN